MKTTKGGKVMNPTDAYRKQLRKRELKRNKKERKKVREVGFLKKDPDQIMEQIQKLEVMKAEGALDKARKHKKRHLEDTLKVVIKKRKELEEKGEQPVMFSHLGPPRRRTSAEEEEMVRHPKPEDSVYYHPTLNPSGDPPPGKPPMFKSSIGPRIPLSAASSSGTASSAEDGDLSTLPPLPPPPPLPPQTGDTDSVDGSMMPASLPLPPPPPMPPKPAVTDLTTSLPLPPLPPPPPGPPPKEQLAVHLPLPPPPPRPPFQLSTQPPPPGTGGNERDRNQSNLDNPASVELMQASSLHAQPPPPPGFPLKSDGVSFESDVKASSESKEQIKLPPPPPPPPRHQLSVPGASMVPGLHPDLLPPGLSRFPPPPPPTGPPPGITGQPVPPGVMHSLLPRPPFGLPPGPPMMRPPLPPGPPPFLQDGARPLAPQKPSYVKSAASTVVKRPLAQHTPELTAMVPASVRVKRESALPKPKPKSSNTITVSQPAVAPVVFKHESTSVSAPKPQSIDDSYTAFLEDMKALGALDS